MILKRDEYKCRICLLDKDVEVHEITSRALGGKVSMENSIVVCYSCHKYLKDFPNLKKYWKNSTKEGLKRAREKGVRLGRNIISEETAKQVKELLKRGYSYRTISSTVKYQQKNGEYRYVSIAFISKLMNNNRFIKPIIQEVKKQQTTVHDWD